MSHSTCELNLTARYDPTIREVSGLGARHNPRSDARELLAVGDRAPVVVTGAPGPDGALRLRRHDVTGLPRDLLGGHRGSQWEAVAGDGAGSVVVLREAGSEVLVLDPGFGFDRRIRLRHPWSDGRGNHGLESLVLMRHGHVLCANQLSPLALVELGPSAGAPAGPVAGSFLPPGESWLPPAGVGELVTLARWEVDAVGMASLNDLAVDGAGRLYALSSRSRRIVRFGDPRPPGTTVRVDGRTALPRRIGRAGAGRRAEGLLLDDMLGAFVALDQHEGGPALFQLGSGGH